MKFTRNLLGSKNQKGMALLLAVFTVVVITYLVMEISYDTNIEYIINSQAVNRLKAYYTAKSGVQLSLLRIKMFNKVSKQFGAQIPPAQRKMLDLIWSFPFAWPPLLPAETSGVDKDLIQAKVKESKIEGSYVATIADEGSKIDLNDLNSPSKGLRDISKKLMTQIFENRMKNDEDWARKNRDLKYEQVINNIIDWVSSGRASLNGGDKKQAYSDLQTDQLPPNRGFRSVEELRLVAGMDNEIFSMLKDRVTVYGMRAINPNHASAEVLKALDPSFKDEIISKIINRREDEKRGHFVDENDFWGFVKSEGANVSAESQKSIPLVFNDVSNFRIKSAGAFANVAREIEVVVFDFSSVSSTIATRLQKESQAANPQAANSQGTAASGASPPVQKNNDPLPKGPPRIVYWSEK